VGRVLLFVVACAGALVFTTSAVAGLSDGRNDLASGAVAAALSFVLSVLFVRWDRLRLRDIGGALRPASFLRCACGFAAGLGLVAVWCGLSSLGGAVHWVRAAAPGLPRCALALLTYLALACREELAFRGYPLRRLEHVLNAAVGQAVVALLFALEHRLGGASWSDALLGAGTGSLLFGAATLATRGLAVPIGLHAAWNFGQWALGLKGAAGLWQAVSAPSQETLAYRHGLFCHVAVMLTGALAFARWRRSTRGARDGPAFESPESRP
jgi:membrane protease YdiL (CAAX protease family)